jgi:hypothetical protein
MQMKISNQPARQEKVKVSTEMTRAPLTRDQATYNSEITMQKSCDDYYHLKIFGALHTVRSVLDPQKLCGENKNVMV